MKPPLLILASGSPRRQQLMREAGYDFTVRVTDIEENYPATLNSAAVPVFLAEQKALAFPESEMKKGSIVITADTVVILNGNILNKPADHAEAFRMLSSLSGRTHEVVTGVCLRQGRRLHSFADSTLVTFRELNMAEIDRYIINHKPFDKAGGYGAQDWIGMVAIERIEGSFYNVMGLPMHKLYSELNNLIFQTK